MKKMLMLSLGLMLCTPMIVDATPEEDREAFRENYIKQYPGVPVEDFINGVYAINADARLQWESIEEFPPYEIALEEGRILFETPFKDGKSYADCFENKGIGIRQNYPYFDTESGQVKTLEQAINECRVSHDEKPLPWKKGKIAAISAYMAYTSRGNVFDVKIADDQAMAAYEAGKKFYYTKRGQLNFSCADCHVYNSGRLLRTDMLSPALGHPTHFPVYRAKWGAMGTLHRRFAGCNEQVRAKPFPAQSEEYRNLEYFLTYMSNGLPVNGPGTRK